MPMTLEAPVLQVDANVIHKVDTTNAANLFSMWTVFARCRDSVAQGRRLENLSWRLWNRETFCCEGDDFMVSPCATSKPQNIQLSRDAASEDMPQLSGSVESVVEEEAVDFSTEANPVEIVRPRIQRQDSCASSRSRGRERHITSDELEKMVVCIMQARDALDAPLPTEQTESTTPEPQCETYMDASTETVTPPQIVEPVIESATIVTRGFSPSQIPLSRTLPQASKSLSPCAIPEPTAAPAPKMIHPKKQAVFALGGSSGSDEESFKNRSLEARKQQAAQPRTKMFQLGGSSGGDSPQKSQLLQRPMPSAQKKTASFNNQVVTQTYTSSAISDTDDDIDDSSAIDDSAIDDDDEDWEEESAEDGANRALEDKIQFRRVDSTAHLTSRRSLITLMFKDPCTKRFGNNIASQSTSALPRARANLNGPSKAHSPNDSDEAPLMMKRNTTRTHAPPMRPINEVPRTAAQPINVTANGIPYQAALSPRTTRRNMLATELTESLRRNLLRERSQKTSTANAVLKRRHTSHDMVNLKQYPERPYMKKEEKKKEDANASSWDQYFNNPFGCQAQAW
ncbi:hypothetical protein N0V88_000838 [Collariella sp. IMI 366227]|nr:hypothetical protein N0V88_000838 [Collariella sp. IMI 366227]